MARETDFERETKREIDEDSGNGVVPKRRKRKVGGNARGGLARMRMDRPRRQMGGAGLMPPMGAPGGVPQTPRGIGAAGLPATTPAGSAAARPGIGPPPGTVGAAGMARGGHARQQIGGRPRYPEKAVNPFGGVEDTPKLNRSRGHYTPEDRVPRDDYQAGGPLPPGLVGAGPPAQAPAPAPAPRPRRASTHGTARASQRPHRAPRRPPPTAPPPDVGVGAAGAPSPDMGGAPDMGDEDMVPPGGGGGPPGMQFGGPTPVGGWRGRSPSPVEQDPDPEFPGWERHGEGVMPVPIGEGALGGGGRRIMPHPAAEKAGGRAQTGGRMQRGGDPEMDWNQRGVPGGSPEGEPLTADNTRNWMDIGRTGQEIDRIAAENRAGRAALDRLRGGMADGGITAEKRRSLGSSEFGLPGKAKGKEKGESGNYPIDTPGRARAALSYSKRYASSGEQSQIRSRVKSKYPGMDVAD